MSVLKSIELDKNVGLEPAQKPTNRNKLQEEKLAEVPSKNSLNSRVLINKQYRLLSPTAPSDHSHPMPMTSILEHRSRSLLDRETEARRRIQPS